MNLEMDLYMTNSPKILVSDTVRGIDFEHELAARFSISQGIEILAQLPRHWDRHCLLNVCHNDAAFTKDEIANALDASKVDHGFFAWIQHTLTGKRPSESLRAKFGLRPLTAANWI